MLWLNLPTTFAWQGGYRDCARREIGAAISERLALDGAAVLMAHYGETALAEQHAARIRAQGDDVAVLEVDLSRPAGNAAPVQRCV